MMSKARGRSRKRAAPERAEERIAFLSPSAGNQQQGYDSEDDDDAEQFELHEVEEASSEEDEQEEEETS